MFRGALVDAKQADLSSDDSDEQEIIEYGFYFLKNLAKLFTEADLERKSPFGFDFSQQVNF